SPRAVPGGGAGRAAARPVALACPADRRGLRGRVVGGAHQAPAGRGVGGQAPRALAARLARAAASLHARRRRLIAAAAQRLHVQNTSVRYAIAISSPPRSGSVAISSSTSARTRARSSSEAAAT